MNANNTNPAYYEGLGRTDAADCPDRIEQMVELRRSSVRLAKEQERTVLSLQKQDLQRGQDELRGQVADAPSQIILENEKRKGHGFLAGWLVCLSGAVSLVSYSLAPQRMGTVTTLSVASMLALLGTTFGYIGTLAIEKKQKLVAALCLFGFLATLTVVIEFSVVRTTILEKILRRNESGTVVITGLEPAEQPQVKELVKADDFFDKASPMMTVAWVFLAFASELGAAVLFNEGFKRVTDHRLRVYREQEVIKVRLASTERGLETLSNAEEACMIAYRIGVTKEMAGTKPAVDWEARAVAWIGVGILAVLLLVFLVARAHAVTINQGPQVVAALDLSSSTGTPGSQGPTLFLQNSSAVAKLLGTVEPCSEITVIGITDDSFGSPLVLLRGTVDCDKGYWGEKLDSARRVLVHAWLRRARTLGPVYKESRVAEATVLASQIFAGCDRRSCHLYIFSDMRQYMKRGLDLDTPQALDVPRLHTVATTMKLVPNLRGVQVHVGGAHAAGKSQAWWYQLKSFWEGYFRSACSDLRQFSPTPDLMH